MTINKEAAKQLPKISKEKAKYFQNCSDKVVKRHHMCAGCMEGQFYCNLFEKWRKHWGK